jgi:hypothetical protein
MGLIRRLCIGSQDQPAPEVSPFQSKNNHNDESLRQIGPLA